MNTPYYSHPAYQEGQGEISPYIQGELDPEVGDEPERGAYVPDLQAIPEVEESSSERRLRRLGNVCELAAGAAGGSSVVFFFAALNISGLGIVLALALTHLYLTATVVGEGRDRAIVNMAAATGTGASALVAASEPLAVSWQARKSQETARQAWREAYNPSPGLLGRFDVGDGSLGGLSGVALLLGLVVMLTLTIKR